MSHSADDAAVAPERPRDGGFTLIEVIVAIGITVVVLVALLPLLVVGIRSTDLAKQVTQAKAVAQGQLDRMRNLPYHVARDAGPYRDVLDYYFKDKTAPMGPVACGSPGSYAVPQPTWTGYVAAGGTRCGYEPATGAMYRSVSQVQGFTVVVSTQFLKGDTALTVVDPPTDYDTQVTGRDAPPAQQIGVSATVLYSQRSTLKPVTTYTQMTYQPTAVNRLDVSADATAVQVGSSTVADGAVSLAAGLLSLQGELTYASTAGVVLASTSAGLATGAQASGAARTLAAPPTGTAATVPAPAGDLSSGCVLACWGGTKLDVAALSADGGLPNIGTASSPMQSLVTGNTNGGFSFNNGATSTYRPELSLTAPLVRLASTASPVASGVTAACEAGSAGSTSYVTASGFARSTAMDASTSPATAEACARTRASTISVFPTSFAPQGVLQVDLEYSYARCLLMGTAHAATVSSDYRVRLRYHEAGGGYHEVADIRPGLTADPLTPALVPMNTPVGGGHTLGDYIASWSALLDNQVSRTSVDGVDGMAALRIPGVLSITTQPSRTGTDVLGPNNVDLSSAVSLTVGAVGCSAEDSR
ncbi:hypothetical protein GCM10009844_12800 [Nocardioides koreensis]|uniref:Prepilin-type N-terminal cleavage/methylation domain-containing protein n=1 Tax=Nocardioides koreensis TaxID=433651 RepID=A0ABN2ZGT0_9ACTN